MVPMRKQDGILEMMERATLREIWRIRLVKERLVARHSAVPSMIRKCGYNPQLCQARHLTCIASVNSAE